jgi:dipeptidyl aminopeptidase/acylaminoacyl peptidase
MRPTRLALLALASALATAAAAAPAILPLAAQGASARRAAAVPEYSIEDFIGTTTIVGGSFSPDGRRILVSSNQTGIYNAFAIPAAGGAPVQLTDSKTNSILVAGYFPADERFLFTSDSGGNELTHVYVRETDGTVRDLTPGAKLKAQFAGWAHDDRSFYVLSNERDPRFFDAYEYQADGYARTLIYRNEQGYDFAAISPDERWIALTKARTTLDSDVFLLDRRSGEMTRITPHTGNVQHGVADFSPDGKSLYLVTDEGHEFAYLVRHDLATGARATVLKPEWDVMFAGFSKGGTYLVVGINNDARTEIRLYHAATMKQVQLPALPVGSVTSLFFTRDERRAAFHASDSRHPRDLFVMDLGGGAPPRRLTSTLNPKIDPDHLVDARVVRFRSYDGVEVPGLLYVPHGASPARRAPALVMVHGGPGGQARIGYGALTQYLVNHGYVVLDINNRGSSGYGKTFFGMDDRRHGDADLGDVVASKRMLIGTGVVDPERIGIIGGSYGGYMVLAALAFRPDEFAAGVDIFGVANWLRTLTSIPPWWESFREALFTEMGDPATDSARLRRISPLFHAKNIAKPLIVLQGANDPRVLKVESDEIVAAVKANGVPVEYVVFPDEGHGFVKKENQITGYRAILEFLDEHLKGKKAM